MQTAGKGEREENVIFLVSSDTLQEKAQSPKWYGRTSQALDQQLYLIFKSEFSTGEMISLKA